MAVASATSFPMTRGRRLALVVGLPVCLALVAGTGFSLAADLGIARYPVNYTVPAGTKSLTLNVTGQLTIKPTRARQATVTGTAKYSLVRSKLTASTTSSGTRVGYACPIPVGDCELDATVAVPATVTELTASSGSGNATVTGTTGPVKLSTGAGDVSVSDASGPLTLNAGSGSIAVNAASPATLSASTGDGNIQAKGVTSTTITANTDSGSISGTGIKTAMITASSGNGGITIAFANDPGSIRVNTDSGDVTLVLPHNSTRYNISANTDQGSVHDATIPRATSPGGHVIMASSGTGDITISEK
jgi:hypothetical protein